MTPLQQRVDAFLDRMIARGLRVRTLKIDINCYHQLPLKRGRYRGHAVRLVTGRKNAWAVK